MKRSLQSFGNISQIPFIQFKLGISRHFFPPQWWKLFQMGNISALPILGFQSNGIFLSRFCVTIKSCIRVRIDRSECIWLCTCYKYMLSLKLFQTRCRQQMKMLTLWKKFRWLSRWFADTLILFNRKGPNWKIKQNFLHCIVCILNETTSGPKLSA